MTSRRHLTLVAAAATLMAAAPILSIFDGLKWLMYAIVTVALVAGAAWTVRSMRGRLWSQVAAMTGALLLALTLFYGNGTAVLGIIPTPATISRFRDLLLSSGEQIQTSYVPAPDIESLVFLTTLGVGGVAILVDLFAVGLRRPALTGLPMLAIYSVPVAVYIDSVSPFPFIIGAVGYLWLLVSDNVDKVRRFGRRFTGEGRGVDLWEPSPLAASGRRLAIAGVLVAVLLPIAVPGMTAGLLTQFGGEGTGPGDGSGRGGRTVDLFANLHGKLTQLNEVDMVRVQTTDREPFYLRFAVADEVELNGFRQRTPTGRTVGPELTRTTGLDRQPASQRYEAKIEVFRSFDMPMMPAYSIPVGTQGLDSSWSYDSEQQVIYSPRSRSANKTYTLTYVHPLFDPAELRQVKPLNANSAIMRNFAVVPNVPAVQEQVDTLIKGKTTVYDKVRALYDFFSQKNGFQYDLSTQQGTTGQHITDFLQQKKGFCEQYAAALTWMVRAAGIPARVAFGFTRGSKYSGGVYTLTTRNLHAWTEVYFEGYGWVPFDATPSAMVNGSVTSAWAPNVDAPEDIPGAGPSLSPGANPTTNPGGDEITGPNNTECPDGPCTTEGGSTETPTPAWVWWSVGGGGLALLLLLLPALRRQMLRRRRSAAAEQATPTDVQPATDGQMRVVGPDVSDAARRRAHAAWDELMDTLVDYRIPLDVAETPRMTAERLVKSEGLDVTTADRARLLGHAEERARYSQRPAAAEGLAPAVKEVRRTIAAQAGRWVRLTAVLLPPSVIQRWGAAASHAAARFSARSTDARLALRRLTSPLRLRKAR